MREVMQEVFEFILSMLLIGGCGFMLYVDKATNLASGIITLVVGYWFQQRSNASAVNNLLRQSPTVMQTQSDNVSPTTVSLECNTNLKQP